MSTLTLDVLWYLVIIVSLGFYIVLDGFDLGVGSLHLFVSCDSERRKFLNAIGPVWDGNEVWLVIVGGALFAGFPEAFATIFSSFYVFTMLLLVGLIFRAVSIEFRSKESSKRWRDCWDKSFSFASIFIAFGAGLVLGNLIQGIPLNAQRDFTGNCLGFIRPYPILFGITTVILFAMHGSVYLVMKTEGSLHQRIQSWVGRCIKLFIGSYILLTIATFFFAPHMALRLKNHPLLFVIPLTALLLIFNISKQLKRGNSGWAFISSSLSLLGFLSLFPIGTFPLLVRSSINPEEYSLSLKNAASSDLTLKVLLIIVLIGIPLVLAYGSYIYRVFRGKVRLDDHSY